MLLEALAVAQVGEAQVELQLPVDAARIHHAVEAYRVFAAAMFVEPVLDFADRSPCGERDAVMHPVLPPPTRRPLCIRTP